MGEKINIPLKFANENKIFINKFAFLMKRSVLNKVGIFNENFSSRDYGLRDYELRVLTAGYRNILCKNSFIIFFGTQSNLGKSGDYRSVIQNDRDKLNTKWGFNTEYYLYARQELVQLVDEPTEKSLNILDIGCGCGALMGELKSIYPNSKMYGVELNSKVAKIASSMGTIVCGNIENEEIIWEEEFFDYVILGDVLEHLMNPENVLIKLRKYLKTGGHIIVSMPNMKHYSVLIPLLCHDVFPYSDAGILDKTHVKMYTGIEIQKLLIKSGYEIEISSYTEFGQPNEEEDKIIDMLVSLMKTPSKESFLAYQYIFKAIKKK